MSTKASHVSLMPSLCVRVCACVCLRVCENCSHCQCSLYETRWKFTGKYMCRTNIPQIFDCFLVAPRVDRNKSYPNDFPILVQDSQIRFVTLPDPARMVGDEETWHGSARISRVLMIPNGTCTHYSRIALCYFVIQLGEINSCQSSTVCQSIA